MCIRVCTFLNGISLDMRTNVNFQGSSISIATVSRFSAFFLKILIAMFIRMSHIPIWGYFSKSNTPVCKTVLFPSSRKLMVSMMLQLLYFTKQELCILTRILIGCILSHWHLISFCHKTRSLSLLPQLNLICPGVTIISHD